MLRSSSLTWHATQAPATRVPPHQAKQQLSRTESEVTRCDTSGLSASCPVTELPYACGSSRESQHWTGASSRAGSLTGEEFDRELLLHDSFSPLINFDSDIDIDIDTSTRFDIRTRQDPPLQLPTSSIPYGSPLSKSLTNHGFQGDDPLPGGDDATNRSVQYAPDKVPGKWATREASP